MKKRELRVQVVMNEDELAELDEWRAANKIWSRSDAVRKLIAEGIKRRSRTQSPKP